MDQALAQSILSELKELRSGTDAMKGQIRDLRTVLLGAVESETPFGRLPMAEEKLAMHGRRLEVLEIAHIRANVYGRIATFLAGLLGALLATAANVLLRGPK